MTLSHKDIQPKTSAKIEIYILTRADLLCPLFYEIPCSKSTEGTVSIS